MNDIKREIPQGWDVFVDQMQLDIEVSLRETGNYDNFKYLQIKEKFGQLRVYVSNSTPEVDEIIRKYQYMSQYVCSLCGEPAIYQTHDYILPYCLECVPPNIRSESMTYIDFDPILKLPSTNADNPTEIDCSDIWAKYLDAIDTSAEEFSWDNYDWCYECTGYGDDYSTDENGDLVSNCTNCPHNKYIGDD